MTIVKRIARRIAPKRIVLKWQLDPMSGREIKTSPDATPYTCAKTMFCYKGGIFVGQYYVGQDRKKTVYASVDIPNKPTNGLCFNTSATFSTQKAAKEWITAQLIR